MAARGYPTSGLEGSTGWFAQSLRGLDWLRLGRGGTDPPICRRRAIYTPFVSLSNGRCDI
jgi:hypothetical protein